MSVTRGADSGMSGDLSYGFLELICEIRRDLGTGFIQIVSDSRFNIIVGPTATNYGFVTQLVLLRYALSHLVEIARVHRLLDQLGFHTIH